MNKVTPSLYVCIVLSVVLAAMQRGCVADSPAAPAVAGSPPVQTTAALHITILRDVSPSMQQDGRHETAGEVIRMAAALLDCRLTIVEFASNAQSASYVMPADRDELLRFLGRAELGAGTSYLTALEKIPPTTTAAVFLSDGEPIESRDDVLTHLKRTLACPLHAVAIEANAEAILRDMAASTGGGFHRARDARELVDAFLRIFSQVTSLRIRESSAEPIDLPGLAGHLLCIGIDAEPKVYVGGQTVELPPGIRRQGTFRLPDTSVQVVAGVFSAPRNVSVALRATDPKRPGHLIVAAHGGSELGLKLERLGNGKLQPGGPG